MHRKAISVYMGEYGMSHVKALIIHSEKTNKQKTPRWNDVEL